MSLWHELTILLLKHPICPHPCQFFHAASKSKSKRNIVAPPPAMTPCRRRPVLVRAIECVNTATHQASTRCTAVMIDMVIGSFSSFDRGIVMATAHIITRPSFIREAAREGCSRMCTVKKRQRVTYTTPVATSVQALHAR